MARSHQNRQIIFRPPEYGCCVRRSNTGWPGFSTHFRHQRHASLISHIQRFIQCFRCFSHFSFRYNTGCRHFRWNFQLFFKKNVWTKYQRPRGQQKTALDIAVHGLTKSVHVVHVVHAFVEPVNLWAKAGHLGELSTSLRYFLYHRVQFLRVGSILRGQREQRVRGSRRTLPHLSLILFK